MFAGIEGAGLVVLQEPLLKGCSVVFCCWKWQLGRLTRGLLSLWAATGCLLGMLRRCCYKGRMISYARCVVFRVHFSYRRKFLVIKPNAVHASQLKNILFVSLVM